MAEATSSLYETRAPPRKGLLALFPRNLRIAYESDGAKMGTALLLRLELHMASPAVLIVVDVQNGFLDPYWGPSNNPACEDNVRALLAHWRANDWPIVLVQHDSTSPTSPLRPGQPGHDLQPGVDGEAALRIHKTVNSAFYGTPNLEEWLTANKYTELVVCGIMTNFCCETTARMGGNLGYSVTFALDATRTFDHEAIDGSIIPAETIYNVTAANLNGEFATVLSTEQVIARA